jgi:hypothetical protein
LDDESDPAAVSGLETSGRLLPESDPVLRRGSSAVMEDVPVEQIGWGEVTYDLEDVFSVHEAIAWAEQDAGIRRRPVQSLGRSNP